jgi:Golgi-body localisation protein domain/RNA pol II promoter Fmp27 protein domain
VEEKTDAQEELEVVRAKIAFLDRLLRNAYLHHSDAWTNAQVKEEMAKNLGSNGETAGETASHPERLVEPEPDVDEPAHFKNRFIIHNLQLKWHNDIRNILFNYIHQISRRRGFIYYMSQRAIRFLNDIVREQRPQHSEPDTSIKDPDVNDADVGVSAAPDDVVSLIQQLLDDKTNFTVFDETHQPPDRNDRPSTAKRLASVDLSTELSDIYAVKNEYSVQLIAPQIQLQSQKNVDAAVIMSAESMYSQIVAIMDKESIDDEVGGLIQRRFTVGMDHAQFFVAHKKSIEEWSHRSILSNVYGANAEQWPPWIPLETVYDFNADPFPFTRMVERTSASMRYDKHNPLRLKLNDRVHEDIFQSAELASLTPLDRRVDDISVHFPRVIVTADSAQYYALYVIVTDLLIYAEPLVKRQNVELDKILLASDFSDLIGAPEMVYALQERIRQLEEIDLQFRVNSQSLDEEGCRDQVELRKELNNCEDELFFLMKAVTMCQEKHEEKTETVPTMRWYLSAREIIWHMICDDKSPFVDLGLSNATYRRYDNNDSSNYNTLEIEMMQGINLLPQSLYTDVIGPYFSKTRTVVDAQRSKMLRVYWYMLESIGGIPIMDHFEVNLFPLDIKIEHDFGKKVFDYMFPEPPDSALSGINNARQGAKSRRQRQDADDSESESDLDSVDTNPPASSQTSLNSNSSKSHTSRRPISSGGQTLKQMTSLHAIGEESQKQADAVSIASKKSNGSDNTKRPSPPKSDDKDSAQQSDDLTQMLSRASQNITLVYVKVPSTVLCLSYKVWESVVQANRRLQKERVSRTSKNSCLPCLRLSTGIALGLMSTLRCI